MDLHEPEVSYYQDDHNLPIYASLDYEYPVDRIIDVFLMYSMPLHNAASWSVSKCSVCSRY